MNIFFPDRSSDNTVMVTCQLLGVLNVKVTRSSLQNALIGHPDYPGIISITDTLSKFKVANTIAKVDEDQLAELDGPFIARLSTNNGSFVVVQQITNGAVTYLQPGYKNKQIIISEKDFLKIWTGIVVFAEAYEDSGEQQYESKRKTEIRDGLRLPAVFFSFVLFAIVYSVVTVLQANTFSIAATLLTWLKLSGCIVSGLLLTHEIDKNNPLLQFVCKPGKKVNCNAILNSNASRLFSWLSWSEIGFFYFSGGLLTLLFSAQSITHLWLLAWLNVLALPYTIFSVYYQWRVSKQWCLLCLIVQSLLLAEFAVALIAGIHTSYASSANDFLTAALAFALPVLFWVFAKKMMIRAKAADGYKREYLRLKYDPLIFKSHVSSQKHVAVRTIPANIEWGNMESQNVITMVCSPFCKPCALAYPVVRDILQANDDVKVQLVFSPSVSNIEQNLTSIRHLLALEEKQATQTEAYLDDWWKHAQRTDYKGFSRKYPLNGELMKQDEKISAMSNWCTEMQINHTPTIFINGYELPGAYTVEDVRNVLGSWNWTWEGLQA